MGWFSSRSPDPISFEMPWHIITFWSVFVDVKSCLLEETSCAGVTCQTSNSVFVCWRLELTLSGPAISWCEARAIVLQPALASPNFVAAAHHRTYLQQLAKAGARFSIRWSLYLVCMDGGYVTPASESPPTYSRAGGRAGTRRGAERGRPICRRRPPCV